jgi:hypothetical protein
MTEAAPCRPAARRTGDLMSRRAIPPIVRADPARIGSGSWHRPRGENPERAAAKARVRCDPIRAQHAEVGTETGSCPSIRRAACARMGLIAVEGNSPSRRVDRIPTRSEGSDTNRGGANAEAGRDSGRERPRPWEHRSQFDCNDDPKRRYDHGDFFLRRNPPSPGPTTTTGLPIASRNPSDPPERVGSFVTCRGPALTSAARGGWPPCRRACAGNTAGRAGRRRGGQPRSCRSAGC